MLLTIRKDASTLAARVYGDAESFRIGAVQLPSLMAIPGHCPLTWKGSFPAMGLHVDVDERAIFYWGALPVEAIEDRVGRAWPGWKTYWLRDRFEEQLAMAGIDIWLPVRSSADLQMELIERLGRCCHHEASNPARELGPRLGATRISSWTDEARGSMGPKAEKLEILERLKKAVVQNSGSK
jgi:hypothetical protein